MKTALTLNKRPRHNTTQQGTPSCCLKCGSKKGYVAKKTIGTLVFRKENFTISYEHMACAACGATLLTQEQLKSRIQIVVAAYQKQHGLMTAAEFIQRRKALGFTSRRAFLAATPELAEATIKRLESGQRVQDKTTDLAIRKVFEDLEKEQIIDLFKVPLPSSAKATTHTIQQRFNAPPPPTSRWGAEPLVKAACIVSAASFSLFAAQPKVSINKEIQLANTCEEIHAC
jgi:hypothetical protein